MYHTCILETFTIKKQKVQKNPKDADFGPLGWGPMVHSAPDSFSKGNAAFEKCLRGCPLALILPECSKNRAKS